MSIPRIVSGLYSAGTSVSTRYGDGTVTGIWVGPHGRAIVLVLLSEEPILTRVNGSTTPLDALIGVPAEFVYEVEL